MPDIYRAVRKYCMQCGDGSRKEVELCPIKSCALYEFRFGKTIARHEKEIIKDTKKRTRRKKLGE